ncbi:MAG: ParB/RepB/Spo0J family partition protein [Clostridium sp.]
MAKKGALGRGLLALIPEDAMIQEELKAASVEVNIDDVFPNKEQPRKNFDSDKIDSLAESLKLHGMIQPIIVKKEGEFYKIIAGERRWRAARKAGLKTVSIIEKELSNQEIAEISLIENIQREDLNPIEEAIAYKKLSKEFSLTQEDIALRVGKSRTSITNTMRLLTLHDDVIDSIANKELSEGHGKIIAGIEDKELQLKISQKVINEELNVRQTEKLIKDINSNSPSQVKECSEAKDVHTRYAEDRLEEILGTKVNINLGKKKSKIEIVFHSESELNRILEILSKE